MKNQNYSGEQIINEILENRHEALRVMYPRYKESFLKWGRSKWQPYFDEDTLQEAYLEAMTVFYTNIVSKRLTVLTTYVENYLIGIGNNYLRLKANKSKLTAYFDTINDFEHLLDSDILTQTIENELDNEQKTQLRDGFAQLGKQCQKLLQLSFYDNLCSAEIMDKMGYDTDNTLYAARARCLRQLRNLIIKK